MQILRKAFEAMLKDAEFIADGKNARLNIDSIPTDEIARDPSGLFDLDAALVAKLKDVLYN